MTPEILMPEILTPKNLTPETLTLEVLTLENLTPEILTRDKKTTPHVPPHPSQKKKKTIYLPYLKAKIPRLKNMRFSVNYS